MAGAESHEAQPGRVVGPGFHARVREQLRRVPPGWVTTYGDLAAALGARSVARHVGFALAALPAGSDVPWHRVVTARGTVAALGSSVARTQARRLRAEGVRVDARGRVQEFSGRRWLFLG
jgi:methylated-DNA-protein-cysteine methyltransferase-like protein